MQLSPWEISVWVLLCVTSTSSTLISFKKMMTRPMRQLSSFTCPRVRPNTPEFFNDITNRESDSARLNSLYADAASPRTTVTAQEFFLNREANGRQQFISQRQQDIGDDCIKLPPCDKDAKFRTIDGSCNNLEFPQWGLAGAPLVRILPAFYSDGKHKLRESEKGGDLPNARQLHTSLLTAEPVADGAATYAVMSWGQLVSHDTARVMDQQPEGNVAQCLCCSNTRRELPPSVRPRNCLPISVPARDPFYSAFSVSCLNFMRSMITDDKKCIITPSQFISDVTHFVDASFLYGSSLKEAGQLRTFSEGQLRSQTASRAQYLPNLPNGNRHCPRSNVCYQAGDDRVNQNPMLAVLQVMFLRLHNQMAKRLADLNNHWRDETLYQESRKIVTAVFQHITYSEYLPMIISSKVISEQLLAGTSGLVLNQYDKFLNPGTFVSFTSAAFRAFHSMIPDKVKIFDEQRQPIKSFQLSDVFFKPDLIQQEDMFGHFVRGLTFQPAEKMNVAFTKEITNLLFKSSGSVGVDLVTSDLMRGRDHGLPGYNLARISCGLPRAKTFTDLLQDMEIEDVEGLRQMYNSVDDVDLYMGAVLERAEPGTKLGPTLQCIIVEQFRRWKDGDRFFYTFSNNPGAFSPSQLAEVEKMSLAKLICLVTDVQTMQPQAFRQPDSGSNKLIPCSSMIQMDLIPWVESNR